MKKRVFTMLLCLILMANVFCMPVSAALNSWTKTDNIADNMINAALAQVGMKNADFASADGMPKADWCAYFIIWCSRVSGAGSAKILPNSYSYGSTGTLADKACDLGKSTLTCFDTTAYNYMVSTYGSAHKTTGTRSSYGYQAGDLIFFKWTGTTAKFASHVGLIYKVSGNTIYYVDGNGSANSGSSAFYTRSYVNTHTIAKTDSQISAVMRVNYGSSASAVAPKLTWTDYSSKPTTIYNTDALLSKTLSVSNCSISDVTKVGIEIWNGTATTKLDGKTETPTPKNGVINMYYTVNDELGYTLTKNTKYQYRFLAVINGTTYYSPYYSFVTGPNQGYTVSFNANGGSCSTSSIKVANGAAYGTLPTPTRTNYNFTGWYTTSSGGSKITSSTTATLSGNQTLYAHWTHVCANGHTYNSGTVTKQPTATSTGVKTYTCTLCGATKTESIPATGIQSTPMYRMYNPNSGEHFYTGSTVERDDLVRAGWKYEGIGWYAPTNSGDPVYRLYNPYAGEHHYTTSAAERDNLVKVGWKYEGVGWLTASSNQVPIYRVYNPNEFANNHHYTASLAERNYLISIGWRNEGIGWYGVAK